MFRKLFKRFHYKLDFGCEFRSYQQPKVNYDCLIFGLGVGLFGYENTDCDIDQSTISKIDKIFLNDKLLKYVPGVSYGIVMDGKLVHSKDIGLANIETSLKVGKDTRFRIASMSKSFTAMAILKLRDEGKIASLDDPVAKYVPAVSKIKKLSTDSPDITIRHLLTHSSGLPQDDPWADRLLDMSLSDFDVLLSSGLNLASPTGTQYEYSNLGYAILGAVIQSVTSQSYSAYITASILQPLGMKESTYEVRDIPLDCLAQGYRWENEKFSREELLGDGVFGAMGGLMTTMNDFSKYVIFHMNAYSRNSYPTEEANSASSSSNNSTSSINASTWQGPICKSSVLEMHQLWRMSHVGTSDGMPLPKPTATTHHGRIDVPVVATERTGESSSPAKLGVVVGYGYGLRTSMFSNGVVSVGHAGGLPGFGSDWRLLPSLGVAIISFGNHTYAPMYEANQMAVSTFVQELGALPNKVSLSPFLAERSAQVRNIVEDIFKLMSRNGGRNVLSDADIDVIWKRYNTNCFADNFFQDKCSIQRTLVIKDVLSQLGGEILSYTDIDPKNQLRGTFYVVGKNGKSASVFVTMTPEKVPKVQEVTIEMVGSS